MIDSNGPTVVLTSAGTITNAKPTINLEFALEIGSATEELATAIGSALVIDDTNIAPSLDANTSNLPLRSFQRISEPPPYLQSYKCSLVTCANQT